MSALLEKSDLINTPIECFYFHSNKDSLPVKPHWHYYMEILYVINGVAQIDLDNASYVLHSGGMILLHPKTVHAISSNHDFPLYMVGIKLDISHMHLTTDYAPKLRSIFRFAEKKQLHIVFNANETSKINASEIFQRCIQEYRMKHYCYDMIIHSELYKLLIGIVRCWQDKGFVIGHEIYAEDEKYDIYNITEYIDANIHSNLRVTDIAAKCQMSYSHFAKKFLHVYHESCKSYIEKIRIHKTKDYLMFTDFDITYISLELGFSDSSHMIKSFKGATGLTPGEYRKRAISNHN
ncbi:helix-turn-helix transcriptional regulator [Cellulosilyticum ruminicola]|uniref:helix-turn-helix transcriptional regulator n=1 Tax=Cellulosilyticum ruminicola TaxID=425254 RepID=UPI0006D1B13B|nr:AraC family transcriptional regulator [Cellulosilyticum ruminicola]